MPPKVRELKARMRRAGFLDRSAKGSHTVWTHPELPNVSVTLSGNDGRDARNYQLRKVGEALAKLERIKKGQS